MAWLVGNFEDDGWLIGAPVSSDGNKKIVIESPNLVVDKDGNPVTHTFQYWYVVQTNPDSQIYNSGNVAVVDKGTNLTIVDGEGEVNVSFALVGGIYRLIAFDSNESNYFRYTAAIVEAV